jgi:hypothetical protein
MQIESLSIAAASAAQAQSAADLLLQSTLYSASVGGKTYTADIGFSSGQYVATVPDLPGISASGGTLLMAENNLNARINLMA